MHTCMLSLDEVHWGMGLCIERRVFARPLIVRYIYIHSNSTILIYLFDIK